MIRRIAIAAAFAVVATSSSASAAELVSTDDVLAEAHMGRADIAAVSGLPGKQLDAFIYGAQVVSGMDAKSIAYVLKDPARVSGTAVQSKSTTDTPVRYTDDDGNTVQTFPEACVGSCEIYSQSAPAAPSGNIGSGAVDPNACMSLDANRDCADVQTDGLTTANTTSDSPNLEFQQLETQSFAPPAGAHTRGAPINKIKSGCHEHTKRNQIQTILGTDLVRLQVTIVYCWNTSGDIYSAYTKDAKRQITTPGVLQLYSFDGPIQTPAPDQRIINNGHVNGGYRAWRVTTWKRSLPYQPDPHGDLSVKAYGYGDGASG